MRITIHRADSRGFAEHGWLTSYHSFSFANYYDPDRMGFGLLRVLNDDIVEPGKGFGTHPHQDMEIISIPLSGSLRHQDSMGHHHIIHTGEVQVLSAGSGITHSEFNHSQSKDVNFLQLWIHPRTKGLEPSYHQKAFDEQGQVNHFQTLVSPTPSEQTLMIQQDAWISMARLDAGAQIEYSRQKENNGVYLFVIDGQVVIQNEKLNKRDAIGLVEAKNININAREQSHILCIDAPMA